MQVKKKIEELRNDVRVYFQFKNLNKNYIFNKKLHIKSSFKSNKKLPKPLEDCFRPICSLNKINAYSLLFFNIFKPFREYIISQKVMIMKNFPLISFISFTRTFSNSFKIFSILILLKFRKSPGKFRLQLRVLNFQGIGSKISQFCYA